MLTQGMQPPGAAQGGGTLACTKGKRGEGKDGTKLLTNKPDSSLQAAGPELFAILPVAESRWMCSRRGTTGDTTTALEPSDKK